MIEIFKILSNLDNVAGFYFQYEITLRLSSFPSVINAAERTVMIMIRLTNHQVLYCKGPNLEAWHLSLIKTTYLIYLINASKWDSSESLKRHQEQSSTDRSFSSRLLMNREVFQLFTVTKFDSNWKTILRKIFLKKTFKVLQI